MRKQILPSTKALIAVLAIAACKETPVTPPPPPPPPPPPMFQPGPLGAVTVKV